jgi:hypothetical protein
LRIENGRIYGFNKDRRNLERFQYVQQFVDKGDEAMSEENKNCVTSESL